jgi:hypothetical protein
MYKSKEIDYQIIVAKHAQQGSDNLLGYRSTVQYMSTTGTEPFEIIYKTMHSRRETGKYDSSESSEGTHKML